MIFFACNFALCAVLALVVAYAAFVQGNPAAVVVSLVAAICMACGAGFAWREHRRR